MPTTAIVPPAAPAAWPSSAPSWAAPSMPSASPETTTSPARLRWLAKARAFSRPCAVGLRLPTMAIDSACEQLDPAVDVEQRRRVGGLEQRRADSADRRAPARRARPARAGRAGVEPGAGWRRAGRRSPAARSPAPRPRPRRRAAGAPRSRRRARPAASRTRASRRRAASRPTPGVATRRSHAASSSRSIMVRAAAVREDPGGGRASRGGSRRDQGCENRSPGETGSLDRQDQRVRHALEHAEHEQHAVALVRKLDPGLDARRSRSGRPRPCRGDRARARGRARCRRSGRD